MAKIKSQGVESIIANIEKMLGGKGVIQRYGDKPKTLGWDQILSFGYPEVDEASNCGGIARGKVIEIFGPESGGKSFLSLKLIASAQKMGLNCCLVDAEQAFDPKWAAKHGVNTDDLYVIDESMSAEKTLDYVSELCKSGGFGLVVVDSTAALIPQKELEGSVGDQDYALLARAMSKACRKIIAGCGKTKTTCVFLNQVRDKMGVVFGNPETTPGGKALKFYSSQRILVIPGKVIKVQDGKKEKVVARKSMVKFVKNKTAPPMGECTIEIVFYEEAMSPVVKLCNLSKEYKLIGMREGVFQIKKDVVGEKKNIDTGSLTVIDLADYLVKNKLVETLIKAYMNAAAEAGDKVDKVIESMLSDPKLIVSPLEGKTMTVENVKNDDALIEKLGVEDDDAPLDEVEDDSDGK